ncbi:DUF433 domain-containing protein [cf. Phormidesmis sp. LEGE 11477]|uniref:DUF433 domain-containing protein n=1 Tax=cf. Phormidesmis sp. LEGE 11477 TaxID=1828680 RepID=UPI00187E85E2|nr:DUF433 domain-containing protein [cf. Phormidesmis sp. LEGE 11477]MBE9064292.1 DUF433 domain-containing protein [cf. Phormidesmis sp. LEGE 11477]
MNAQVEFKATAPPLRWDESGGIRIGKTRVTLDSVLASYHKGAVPEEIALQYSVLSLSEIYAVIAYYLSHRQLVDDYLKERDHQTQQWRQQLSEKHNLTDLRQRLLARRQSQEN